MSFIERFIIAHRDGNECDQTPWDLAISVEASWGKNSRIRVFAVSWVDIVQYTFEITVLIPTDTGSIYERTRGEVLPRPVACLYRAIAQQVSVLWWSLSASRMLSNRLFLL
jgi:hypothetical protein